MKLRVLGCSGSELAGERHGSYLVDGRILVDLGAAVATLSLEEQCRVRDVLLTHAHLDHTKDLGFLAENVFARIPEPIRVWATEETLDLVRDHLLNGIIWPDFSKLPSADEPTLVWCPLPAGGQVDLDGVRVTCRATAHCPGSAAWLLESGDGAILMTGDTGPGDPIWDEIGRAGPELSAVFVEVSFPSRLRALARSARHQTPESLGEDLRRLDGRDLTVYLCHLKGPTREETLAELAEIRDPRLVIATAGLEVSV